jgi:hypothetical protein
LLGVKNGSQQHDTEVIGDEIEKLATAVEKQSLGARGVASFLTDDQEYVRSLRFCVELEMGESADARFRLQLQINETTGESVAATKNVLTSVKEDAHDTEVIHHACDNALALNNKLKAVMERYLALLAASLCSLHAFRAFLCPLRVRVV